ncbi:DUF317 domain-containing protein [Streptomyces sp. H27-C3]|uniref:DUF317 domain-containing protein n=1 Tax=Streptomyces sp. H27-C3 TaxID=3046305 RepID=UPI0024BA8653|nr:DUF317 domain-containing protein [Streptomyces sp. H27-C3]MDJ0467048.1 DUF317 domain-containing protein [Streptomyces sp. H27-C3]
MTSSSTLLIAPRYLAGPDAAGTVAVGRLLRAAGWRERSAQGGTCYRTADGRREALFLPEGACQGAYDTERSWRFAARPAPGARARWSTAFAASTPPELVAAFAAALAADDADPATGGPHYLAPPVAPHEATQALAEAGWIRDLGAGIDWYAPTMQAAVAGDRLTPGSADAKNWLFAARRFADRTVLWHALATPGTPGHLVNALCRAMADPAPVARTVLPDPCVGRLEVNRTA